MVPQETKEMDRWLATWLICQSQMCIAVGVVARQLLPLEVEARLCLEIIMKILVGIYLTKESILLKAPSEVVILPLLQREVAVLKLRPTRPTCITILKQPNKLLQMMTTRKILMVKKTHVNLECNLHQAHPATTMITIVSIRTVAINQAIATRARMQDITMECKAILIQDLKVMVCTTMVVQEACQDSHQKPTILRTVALTTTTIRDMVTGSKATCI